MSTYRDNLARPLPKQQETTQYAPQPNKINRTAEQRAAAREKLAWLGTLILCIVISLILVSRYAGMVSLNYQLQTQRDQLQKLQDDKLKLEQTALQLQSPDRIKDYAANVLHMHPVAEDHIVILPGSSQK